MQKWLLPITSLWQGYANQNVLIYDYNDGTPIDKLERFTRLAVEGKTTNGTAFFELREIYPISAANKCWNLVVSDATIAAGFTPTLISILTLTRLLDVDGSNYNF